jgi:glutamyl-tRNA synthetase
MLRLRHAQRLICFAVMKMDDLYQIALKHAIRNASEYGKADATAVVGKLLAEAPLAKADIKAAMDCATRAVEEANALSPERLAQAAKGACGDHGKKDAAGEEGEKKIALPNAEAAKVVTRFPPEPNGYPHIGHAKALFLNYDAARQYGGKFYLRWDDTNPEAEKAEFVDAIKAGMEWLGITPDRETFVSDDMETLYGYGKKLIELGGAYVCLCPQQKVKELREKKAGCECRGAPAENGLYLWEGMHNGRFKQNQAVVRFLGDMASENTVMCDPVLFRIIEASHYRQGDRFRVWPTYDFDVCIEDSTTGVSHAMRSKEYELRDELYFSVLGRLGLRKPQLVEFSRLSIKGMPVSKRLLKKLIEEKKVFGWDDPRLPTLNALKRRGITRQAIANFVRSFGLSKVESEPPIDRLLVENRRLLEPTADHYFFVGEPVRLHVKGAQKAEVSLRKHPIADRGWRKITAGDSFYIAKKDAEPLAVGESFRLKDLLNAKVTDKGKNFVEAEFVSREGVMQKKIHWVPNNGQALPARLLAPSELFDERENFREESLVTVDGYCEPECKAVRRGESVQFERVGLAVCDDDKKLAFVLSTRL